MAATRVCVGLSACARLSLRSSRGRATRLALDSIRLARPCTVTGLKHESIASLTAKRVNTPASFTTCAALAAVITTPENPDSRSTGAGGGVSVSETEEDDDPFMKEMVRRYELCRRWLASIMGEDPENFNEKDIQRAIEYLMPTALYAKDARPLLLHPNKLFTKRRAQIFDATGRPLAAGFYTGRPRYHNTIYEIYKQFEKLYHHRLSQAYEAQEGDQSGMASSSDVTHTEHEDTRSQGTMRWLNKQELEGRLEELLNDREYNTVIHRLKKLSSQPDSHLVQDFLMKFTLPIAAPGLTEVSRELDENERAHGTGYRKRSVAKAWVMKGSGKITVNDRPFVEYFSRLQDKQQILFPFQVVDCVGQFDASCHVLGGGLTGQAGAIRLAISRALLNFSEDHLEPLQEAGLLIRDTRVVERKKPGQKKARKKFAWVKR
ncbi:28S ribosomal protein S9, mitochondrial [Nematostella vectensis]|uniref:28S ribosomal protein S9, mitochondrial n=1 Tax=Nematostella vectensis TaxID=45351 RepID=UPI00207790C6|nr:28S ribosomal protein S9, mitochondrial [Nematostella vectensis]